MCCGAAQTVLETGAPISWNGSQYVERADGERSSRLAREKGETLPRRMVTPPLWNVVVITGDRRGKPPRWALQRHNANEGREQGTNVGREGFDREQKRMILVIVCEKHSSYLWATTIIGRNM